MFRDGVLSPRSKLLPQDLRASIPYVQSNAPDRSQSVLSVISNGGYPVILTLYSVFSRCLTIILCISRIYHDQVWFTERP